MVKPLVRIAALAATTLLAAGCATTPRQYEEANNPGNYIVKGEVLRLENLHTTRWTDLTEGFALVIDSPGATVTIRQSAEKTTRFKLIEGDHVVIVGGEGQDFVLSSSAPNRPVDQAVDVTEGEPAPKPAEPEPKEQAAAEDEASKAPIGKKRSVTVEVD